MYVKCASNELMLRSDGTVAGAAVVELPPPQAIATIPTTPSAGTSLANLIGSLSYLSHLLPSSRECRGESAPATGPTQQPGGHAACEEHYSHLGVCQEIG